MSGLQKKHLATDSGSIAYWVSADAGPGRPWLVLLPCLTADHRLFDKQVEYFADKANLLLWDPPSHGESRPFSLSWTMNDLAQWLHQILEAEGVDSPILIGQSMGGYTAQAYMELFPGEVAGFISIDSCSLKRRYYSAAELYLLKHTKLMYLSFPWETLVHIGSNGNTTTEYGSKLMESMMRDYEKREYCELAAHGFRVLADAVESGAAFDIACPALLLCGTQDKAGSAKRYNKEWTKVSGIPLIWNEGAGHNSNTDRPDVVNAAIEEFVAGL